MKKKLITGLLFLSSALPGVGQVRINLSVQSPPINEAVFNGKFLKAYQLYEYSGQRNLISPGIEFDNLFVKGTDEAKLHYSIGFYYSNPDFIGAYGNSSGNEYVSEIKSRQINIPLLARGSVKISELIDNNRIGLELGVVTTAWLKYHLSEITSVKIKDANGDIVGETIYQDEGDLVKGAGDKFNFKAVAGLFVYVNRFYLGFRMDLISFGDLYSGRLNNTWKIPAQYSFYQLSQKDGRMKRTYSSFTISFRITK